MPAAAFKDSVCTGHGCHPPHDIIEGSGNVTINGNDAARQGDDVAAHSCGDSSHNGEINHVSSGSSTVTINGQPAVRIGDDVNCGSVVAQGSTNVFIGG